MPEIEIELEPIAEGQAELARELGSWRLRASAYWISDIQIGRPTISELFSTHKRAMPGPMAPPCSSIHTVSRTSGDHRLSRLITGR
jgi:hypothetical protein